MRVTGRRHERCRGRRGRATRRVRAAPGAVARWGAQVCARVRAYNPADFAHLNVSQEVRAWLGRFDLIWGVRDGRARALARAPQVRELFQYIGRYKPHNIDLETKMKVPRARAVGCVDSVSFGLRRFHSVSFGLRRLHSVYVGWIRFRSVYVC